jgi:excisionase family DNA binding protein
VAEITRTNDTITLTQDEAARLSNVSAKTLERLAAAGQPVGRIKVGRRVLFVREALERWLLAQAEGGAR